MLLTNVILTAYCACTICCGSKATGLAANGKKPIQGSTIAASRSIPLGSKVIWNKHTYTVGDRLARRYDSRFDIYFTKHEDAKQFGIRKQQTVEVIK